jgi:hypothetical protein
MGYYSYFLRFLIYALYGTFTVLHIFNFQRSPTYKIVNWYKLILFDVMHNFLVTLFKIIVLQEFVNCNAYYITVNCKQILTAYDFLKS